MIDIVRRKKKWDDLTTENVLLNESVIDNSSKDTYLF